MILYEIAKSMEQHAKLSESIWQSSGDVQSLVDERKRVELALLASAEQWGMSQEQSEASL